LFEEKPAAADDKLVSIQKVFHPRLDRSFFMRLSLEFGCFACNGQAVAGSSFENFDFSDRH
jgi:hypothetical protein